MTTFHDELVSKTTSPAMPTKQAWAAYVRRRFPRDAVAHVQRTFDLSEGEARGAVFASISGRTIDKIIAHRRGGLAVLFEVHAIQRNATVEGLIVTLLNDQQQRIEHERARIEEEHRRISALRSRCDDVERRTRASVGRPAVR